MSISKDIRSKEIGENRAAALERKRKKEGKKTTSVGEINRRENLDLAYARGKIMTAKSVSTRLPRWKTRKRIILAAMKTGRVKTTTSKGKSEREEKEGDPCRYLSLGITIDFGIC